MTIVFRGGSVYTLNPDRPWAQAVAVRGSQIIAVGSEAEVLAAAGDGARCVDLDDRMVIPGFIEAHIHPMLGSFVTSGTDLQVPDREAALAAVADYARTHPDGPVRGFGWRVDMFGPEGPHRQDLDAILPDRPALLFAIDGHSVWVNTATLRRAGITRDSPDPVPGFSYYARDASGEPTGVVLEAPAIMGILGAVDPLTPQRLAEQFAEWAPKAAAAGVTALFDAGMPPAGDDPDGLADIYTDAEARGELPFRVVVSHLCKEPPIDDTVAAVTRLRRFATIYRPRALLDTGATIAFGSDWPGAGWFSTYKPLDAIETAVTRQSVGTPDMAVLEPADQRLDLAQALYAATMGPALQLRLDHRVGSIESGKQADLVVLGHNLFDVEAHRIAETPVDMTMMNGRITHSGSLSL